MFFTERNRFFERGFLVNNESMFVMHEVHSLNGQQRKLRQLKMFSNIDTVAVDAKTDTIYFLDSRQNSLKKLDTISIKTSILTSSVSGTGNQNSISMKNNLHIWLTISVKLKSIMNILVNIHSLDKNLVYISNEMILFDFSYIYCCKITMQQ